jgi:hypothetical protein
MTRMSAVQGATPQATAGELLTLVRTGRAARARSHALR